MASLHSFRVWLPRKCHVSSADWEVSKNGESRPGEIWLSCGSACDAGLLKGLPHETLLMFSEEYCGTPVAAETSRSHCQKEARTGSGVEWNIWTCGGVFGLDQLATENF